MIQNGEIRSLSDFMELVGTDTAKWSHPSQRGGRQALDTCPGDC